MYESFYGLTGKPFQLNPDPSFYFGSKQHRRAMAYLEYGMHQNEGFIVITGEVGAGKTTIVRSLLGKLDSAKVVAAHLVSTHLDAEDILSLVGAAFGVRTKGASKSDVLMSLEAFMVGAATHDKRCLLIVDEAQNLTARAVEELRMLSNFQYGHQSVLQTFLVGQPEFRDILQSPDMLQLRQRVIASCHISPMDRDETQGYIEHRLKCVGSQGTPSFEAGAFDAIFQVSGGIPRRINAVCDRLLLMGLLTEKRDFTADDVHEVAKEIEEEVTAASSRRHASVALEATSALEPLPLGEGLLESGIEVDAAMADKAGAVIRALSAEQIGARLHRLERSLLRLEQINSATLSLLQQVVRSTRKKPESEAPSS